MNQQQQFAIDDLREENRVLREQLSDRRLRLSNINVGAWQRRRNECAAESSIEVAAIVTPETLLTWPPS